MQRIFGKALTKMRHLVRLRDAMHGLMRDGGDAARSEIEAAYEAFTKKYGPLNKTKTVKQTTKIKGRKRSITVKEFVNMTVFGQDPDADALQALEVYSEETGEGRLVLPRPELYTERSGQTSLVPEVTDRERMQVKADRPLRGGDASLNFGLFGSSAAQTDLLDAIAAQKVLDKEPKPSSLLGFLRERGGIKDESGDLKSMGAVKGRPGLVNNRTGLDLDTARELAVEAGFMTDPGLLSGAEAETTTSDLLDLIGQELGGDKVYRAADQDRVSAVGQAADAIVEAERRVGHMQTLEDWFAEHDLPFDMTGREADRAMVLLSQGMDADTAVETVYMETVREIEDDEAYRPRAQGDRGQVEEDGRDGAIQDAEDAAGAIGETWGDLGLYRREEEARRQEALTRATFGAAWSDASNINEFIAKVIGGVGSDVRYSTELGRWYFVEPGKVTFSAAAQNNYGSVTTDVGDAILLALNDPKSDTATSRKIKADYRIWAHEEEKRSNDVGEREARFAELGAALSGDDLASFAPLDMSVKARMERARKMGFDTSKVWYHGTTQDFDAFDPKKANRANGIPRAIFLAEDAATANYFSRSADGSRVIPVYMKGNIFDFRNEDHFSALAAFFAGKKSTDIVPGYLGSPDAGKLLDWVKDGDWGILERPTVQKWLKRKGFDGWYAREGVGQPLTVAVFDPSNIRSVNAAFNPAEDGSADLLASFAGVGAQTGNKSALADAKRMESEGVDRDTIWRETGWGRGVDKKWRFEVDDSASRVIGFGRGALDQALQHGKLYAAYPFFGDTPATFVRGDRMYGVTEFPGGSIRAEGPLPKDIRSVGLHETQHLIQIAEGFAAGGNPGDFTYQNSPLFAERKIYESAHDAYERLAGEVEARVVQKRLDMTPQERRERPFWYDYDVPEDQQIVSDVRRSAERLGTEDDLYRAPRTMLADRINDLVSLGRSAAITDATLDSADDGSPFIGDKEAQYQEGMRLHRLQQAVLEELRYAGSGNASVDAGAGLGIDGEGGAIAAPVEGAQDSDPRSGQRAQIGQALAADAGLRAQALDAFLSPELRTEAIEARAKAQGFGLVGYHGTKSGVFDDPNPFVTGRDFGFHVGLGTPKAANSRLGFPSTFAEKLDRLLSRMFGSSKEVSPEDGAILPLRIRVTNPLRLPDVALVGGSRWSDPVAIAKAVAHPESAAPESLKRWVKQWAIDNGAAGDRANLIADNHIFSRAFAQELDRLGYDAIIYKNTMEGYGLDSLFVWDQSRIRSAYDFYHDDAAGASGLMASNDYVEQDLADRLEALMAEEDMRSEQEIYDFDTLAAFQTYKKPVRQGDRMGHVIMRRLVDKDGKPFVVRVVEDQDDDLVFEMYEDKFPGMDEDKIPRGVSKHGEKIGYVNLGFVGIANFKTHGHRGPLYEVGMVSVNPEHRKRGIAKATYNMIEDMLGTEMMPSGTLLEDGYKHWLRRNPDLVRGHQFHRADEMYYSPRKIKEDLDSQEEMVKTWSREKEINRWVGIYDGRKAAGLSVPENVRKNAEFWADENFKNLKSELAILRGMWRRVPKDMRSKRARDAMFSFVDRDATNGRSMRRDLDRLGYFSGALEAAKRLRQDKGTPEQMLVMMQKEGAKKAEIEATNLAQLFEGKTSVTKQEIISYLEENRVGVREVGYGAVHNEAQIKQRIDEINKEVEGLSKPVVDDPRFAALEEEFYRLNDIIHPTASRQPKWSSYSLDPSNPTYRETVLHLPSQGADQKFRDDLTARAQRREISMEEAQRLMRERGLYDDGSQDTAFRSGHFPEPNIVGHMMTSMVKHEGRPVYLIDQIQSDWGQKLRDGGVRDEAKIAELKTKFDDAAEKFDEKVKAVPRDEVVQTTSDYVYGRRFIFPSQLKGEFSDVTRLAAELVTAEAATTGHPLVNTTDQWVNTTLRRAIRQAAEADAEYIAIPSGKTVLSYNPGDEAGMEGFYNGIVPKNLRNLLRKIDKSSPDPVSIDKLETPTSGMKGEGFTIFKLTDKVKQSVLEQGQPLFSFAPRSIKAEGNKRLTPAARAAYADIVADLETRLSRMMPAGTALKFSERLFHANGREQYGRFRPDIRLVELALAHGPEKALQTGAHEIVHVLRDAGAFTDAEWVTLVERARRVTSIDQIVYRDAYAAQAAKMKLPPDLAKQFVDRRIEEELVAKLAETFVSDRKPSFGAKVNELLNRIKDVITAIAESFGAQGFTTPERVFRRMERGEIARRVAPKGQTSVPASPSRSQQVADDAKAATGLWRPADSQRRAFSVPGGEGTVTIFDRADGFQSRIYAMEIDGRDVASIALAERDVNQFEIIGLRIAKEHQGRGLTADLIQGVEDDLGRPLYPSGIVTPETYAALMETAPERVRFHVQGGKAYDGMYLSPAAIAAMKEGSGADQTDDIAARERHVLGLLQGAVPDQHFQIERSVDDMMASFKDDGTGLDMSVEARKARAEAMGFDTSKVWYHGTDQDFQAFESDAIPGNSAMGTSLGNYVTDDAGFASQYADRDDGLVLPVYVRSGKTLVLDRFTNASDLAKTLGEDVLKIPGIPDRAESYWFFKDGPAYRGADWDAVGSAIVPRLLAAGYDSVSFPEMKANTLVIFDPRNIRSINAVFDPSKSDSAELLASLQDSQHSLIQKAERRFASGQDIDVDRNVVAQNLEAMMPFRGLLPKGTDIATVTKFEQSSLGNRYVKVTVETPSGSTFPITLNRRSAFRMRAGFIDDMKLVVSFRFTAPVTGQSAGFDVGKAIRGELGHEMVHALWRADLIPADVRARLLGHAKTLRVLGSDLNTYLRVIGERSSPGTSGTLEDDYRVFYNNQYGNDPAGLQDVLDQEAVAHLVELYTHGFWSDAEIAPIKADLDAMLSGRFTGRSAKVLARMPKIEPVHAFAALRAPHLPSLGNMARGEVVDPGQGLSDLIELAIEAIGTEQRQGRLNPGLKAQMGRLGAKLYGQYNRVSGVIRTAIPNDLPTLLHEGGHALEDHLDLGPNVEGLKTTFSAELLPLASPGQDQASEGFAEFFRMFIVEPMRVKQMAPNAEAAFRNMLEAQAPELLQTLEAIQAGYNTIINASPAGAVLARTKSTKREDEGLRDEVKQKGLRNTISDRLYGFTRNYVDEKHPLKIATRKLIEMATARIGGNLSRGQRLAIRGLYDPYKLARMMEHARTHATAVLQKGVKRKGQAVGSGPSMRDVLAVAFGGVDKTSWNDERFQQFGAYLIARRMNAEWDRFEAQEMEGVPDPLMSRDAWGKALNDLEAAFPEFKKASASFDAFAANVLDWKFENGFLTKQTYDDLKSRSGWAPLNRIMDQDGPSSLKAKGTNKRKLIFQFKGSSRDFINPIESVVADVYQTQARVELNNVIKALDTLARAAGPNGGLIAERLPSHDMLGKTINLEDQLDALRKQAEQIMEQSVRAGAIAAWDADRVLDEMDLMFDASKSVTLFEATATGEKGERIVYLWENGKKMPILLGSDQLGEDIFNIIAGAGKFGEMGAGLSQLVGFTQVFRAGVTKSPAYIAVNWFRDQLATWALSKHFKPFWTGARGLGDVVKDGDPVAMYQQWAGMSGVETNLIEGLGQERDAMLLRKNGFFAAPTKWQALMRAMEVTELASRVGHMKTAFDNYMADGYSEEEAAFEAAYNSHDVMDFSMRGSKMLQAARLIAFMNAQIQGMYAALRTLKGERDDVVTIRDVISPYLKATEGQPLSVVEKKALPNSMVMWVKLVSIGLFGLALKGLYEDDPEFEELSKGDMGFTHWFFKVNGHWYRVPKPFELAIFSNLFEAGFDKIQKNDPLAMQRFMLSVRETMFLSPELQVGESVGTLVNTLVREPLDKITGKPKYGGAKEDLPQRFRGLPPEMQWDAYTSEFSKMLAAQFGISPYKTDSVIRGIAASVGRDALTVSDFVLPRINMAVGGKIPGVAKQPRADKSVEDMMVISRVMRRAARSSYSTDKFWTEMNYDTGRFTLAAKGYKKLMDENKTGRDANAFLEGLDPERRAFAILEYHYKEKDQDMHPLNRAKQVILAINGVRRQMANENLFVERTKKKGGDNQRIAIPPSQQRVINEILEDMAMREARNAQIALGKPGFAGTQAEMPTDGLWRELNAAAPDIAEELYWRLTHGRYKVYSYEAVKKVWPEVREQLLSEPPGTSLAAPRSSARIETPLQLPALEKPSPKSYPPGMMRLGGPVPRPDLNDDQVDYTPNMDVLDRNFILDEDTSEAAANAFDDTYGRGDWITPEEMGRQRNAPKKMGP